MLTSLLLAIVCLTPPSYKTGGPLCTTAQTQEVCGTCSQAIEWTHSQGSDYYQIQRCDGPSCIIVGNTAALNHYHWTGSLWAQDRVVTHWYPDYDVVAAVPGTAYSYSVRGCTYAVHKCDGPWSTPVTDPGIPRWCYVGGPGGYRYACADDLQRPIPPNSPE